MLVHSLIIISASESIVQSIIFMENSIDVWIYLKERFSQGDLVHIFKLMQKVYAMQEDLRSVTKFYSDLKILWKNLKFTFQFPHALAESNAHFMLRVMLERIIPLCMPFDF